MFFALWLTILTHKTFKHKTENVALKKEKIALLFLIDTLKTQLDGKERQKGKAGQTSEAEET